LRLLALEQLVVHRAHDGGVADGTVVDQDAVHCGHRVQEPSVLDLGDGLLMLGPSLLGLYIVIEDLRVIAEPALDLCPDYRGDLLRRPRRASSAGEAIRGAGDVVDLDYYWLSHCPSLYPMRTAPPAHTRAHTPQPVHFS